MKKSTILMILVIYVVAFLVVGFLGVSISGHYNVNYVAEILITPLEGTVLNEHVENGGHTVEPIINEQDPDHARYNRVYRYETDFEPGLILGFRVQVKPDNSTYSNYMLSYTEKPNSYEVEDKKDESKVYIHIYKAKSYTLTFQSTDGNRTTTKLIVTLF